MKSFEILPHTADVRLRLDADTLEELFQAGVEGMSDVLRESFCSGRSSSLAFQRHITLTSVDTTTLLIDLLSELLTLVHTERVLFCHIVVHQLDEQQLDCTVSGDPFATLDEDIKAVTYHEADVRQGPDGRWTTMLIFDI
jgi:SHS2 domain-containing protein